MSSGSGLEFEAQIHRLIARGFRSEFGTGSV